MADSYIQVAEDGSGKKLQTLENTVGGNDVHAEAVVLVDENGTPLEVLPDTEISVTNAGTFAVQAAQSGTWTVQPGNTANTTAWKVDGSAVTQPISDAAGSLTVDNNGTFAVQVDGAALTSLQLADDVVYTDDTSTHATGTSKGTLIMAAAAPTDGIVDNNDIGAVAMSSDRKLYVKSFTTDSSGNGISSTANALDVNIKSDSISPSTYLEDAPSPSDPSGNMLIARRTDSLSAAEVTTDRDNIALNSTSKGELYVKQTDSVAVTNTRSGTATTSQVADTASSTTVLASNANRLGATIENDSSAVLYLKLGTTASATDYTVRMVQYAYYEVPFNYTGRIDGIWATDPGDGAARVTELT